MRRAVTLLAILLALPASTHAGPPATQPDLDVPARLRDLASPDADVRAEAKLQLMGLPAARLEDLKRHVAAARPLLPAQSVALQDIVTYVYARGEVAKSDAVNDAVARRGFLGVSFLGNDVPDFGDDRFGEIPPKLLIGATFSSRLPGYIAYRYLSDGDVILSIATQGGEYVTQDRVQLRDVIRSLRGGEPVTMRVLRGPKIIDVRFPLDSAPPPDQQELATILPLDAAVQEARQYWFDQFGPLVDGDEL